MSLESKFIRSLIENTRNGNRTSFEQLYKIHMGTVYALSIRILGSHELAEENTIKVFQEVWKSRRVVRRDSPFILWLTAITVFFALEKLRNKGENEEKVYPPASGIRFSPLDIKLFRLPDFERAVYVLKEVQHYKIDEIVDLLLKPKEEIENLLQTAKESLIRELSITSYGELTSELTHLPASIEPIKEIRVPVASTMEIPAKEPNNSAFVKNFDEKGKGRKTEEKKKPFTFLGLFKKK